MPNKRVPPCEWRIFEDIAISKIIMDSLPKCFTRCDFRLCRVLKFMVTKIHVFVEEYCSFDAIVSHTTCFQKICWEMPIP